MSTTASSEAEKRKMGKWKKGTCMRGKTTWQRSPADGLGFSAKDVEVHWGEVKPDNNYQPPLHD